MRNVLITGGGRGIGRACVKRFAENGDRVFFTYNKNEEQAKNTALETGAVMIKGSDPKKIKQKIEKFGKLDVLINNAGIAQQKMFQDITLDDWDSMFNTNIRDMFLITKCFYTDFINNKSGAIVNVSSMWGISGASCEVHYSASKAAVIGFTKALAKEAGPSGIRVNCVAPGVMDTDMNSNIDPRTRELLCEETPLGRLGTSEEAAELIEFLCSDRSSFITGQVILCDGGFLGI